jgi:hypothetical protein
MLRVAICALGLGMMIAAARPSFAEEKAAPLAWYTDYAEASSAARLSDQLLVIVFRDERHSKAYDDYVHHLEASPRFAKAADNFVLCELPTNFEVVLPPSETGKKDSTGEEDHPRIKLLSHPAFAEMAGRPGIAIIDYAHT